VAAKKTSQSAQKTKKSTGKPKRVRTPRKQRALSRQLDYEPEIIRKYFRPPHYESPDDLQIRIIEYFEERPEKFKKTFIVDGVPVERDVPLFTITGLCLHLGFASRQSFYDYEKRPEFSYTISRARLLIENVYEQLLQDGNKHAFAALQNFGWHTSEKTETNLYTVKRKEAELPAKKPEGAPVE